MSMWDSLRIGFDTNRHLCYTTIMNQDNQSAIVPECDDAALLAFVERWEQEQEIYAEFG